MIIKNKLTSHAAPPKDTKRLRPKRFDPKKLGIHYFPPAEADALAWQAAWDLLQSKAKTAGKKLNPTGRNPVEICPDAGWFSLAVDELNDEMAEAIEEELKKLSRPGARREELVGRIFMHILARCCA